MAHSSRTWRGARTPQAQKRVRQAERRHAVLQPRRTAAKTFVKNALEVAASGDAEATTTALAQAASALDRAAKIGAIHPNAAARRKSRLMRKANAAVGGDAQSVSGKAQRQVSKAAATKSAKARIAAGKAAKAKGEQTAAGKARAALSRSTREASEGGTPTAKAAPKATPKPRSTSAGKAAGTSKSAPAGTVTKRGPTAKAARSKARQATSPEEG